MALPGDITISKNASASAAVANAFTAIGGTLIFVVDDQNCVRHLQESTIGLSRTPGRSRFGTIQQPGVPTTNTAKYLWTFSGVFLTALQFNALEKLQMDNTVLTCGLTDNFWSTLITGASSTHTVRLIFNGGQLMDGGCYLDRSAGVNVIPVSFAALEV